MWATTISKPFFHEVDGTLILSRTFLKEWEFPATSVDNHWPRAMQHTCTLTLLLIVISSLQLTIVDIFSISEFYFKHNLFTYTKECLPEFQSSFNNISKQIFQVDWKFENVFVNKSWKQLYLKLDVKDCKSFNLFLVLALFRSLFFKDF